VQQLHLANCWFPKVDIGVSPFEFMSINQNDQFFFLFPNEYCTRMLTIL
jgi:hypothetical protein